MTLEEDGVCPSQQLLRLRMAGKLRRMTPSGAYSTKQERMCVWHADLVLCHVEGFATVLSACKLHEG